MSNLQELLSPLPFARLVSMLMLSVVFLQSGLDKVADRKGNLSWLKGHFSTSPFKNIVPLLLTVITLVELAAGVLSLTGVGVYAISGNAFWGQTGAQLACLAILMLFSGQRIAKDYGGAASLVPYFLLALATLLLCQWG